MSPLTPQQIADVHLFVYSYILRPRGRAAGGGLGKYMAGTGVTRDVNSAKKPSPLHVKHPL